jgi:DNA-binding MarR family transcriptional regulator
MALKLSPADKRRLGALLRTAREYRRSFGKAGRPLDLSPAALESLLALAQAGEATVSQLADVLERDRPATSRAVAELRDRQLVTEVAAPGRLTPYRLSARGQRAVRRFLAA